jgi:hypothetical protein
MKLWRMFALLAAIAGFLLVGCEGGKDRTRAEIVRNYLRQNQLFGEVLKSYSMPTSGDLLWSHTMDPSQAGALAGALGLKWPPPLRDDGGPGGKSKAVAFCSWGWRYCLLALSSYGPYIGQQTRFCLMDTTGHVGWTHDLVSDQSPAISDSGTAALFTLTKYSVEKQMNELGYEMAAPGSKQWADTTYRNEYREAVLLASKRDSFITTFVNRTGKVLGRWACPRAELITAKYADQRALGAYAFMPDSERLIMLMNPRKKAPWFADTAKQYIRCLRKDGSVEWQCDLGESSANELAFPGNGRVIAFGNQEDDRMLQPESRSYVSALYLFNADGDLMSHIERRCPEKIDRFWLLTYEPNYLYFLSDKVEVLDLQSGRMLTHVPLRPLYEELSKNGMWRGSDAELLIRRQLGLSVRDTIPPLE